MSSTPFQNTGLVMGTEAYPNEIIGVDTPPALALQKRIPELDGLRGIAVLMVISFHYINNQLIGATGRLGKLLYKMTSFGWVGVDLFFVLSGFLIGTILIRNRGSKNYFSTFYVRRIVRIVPNYYLLIGVFLIIGLIPLFASDYFLAGNRVIPIWAYLTMLHNIFIAHLQNFGNTSLSITWSIGVEEQFYIVFPFLIFILKEKWLPFLLALAILLAPLIRMQYSGWIPAYVLLPCRMDSMAFGVLIAWANHYYSLTELVKKYRKHLLALLMLDVFICGFLAARYGDLGVFKNTLFAIVFSLMLVFALVYTDSVYGAFLRIPQLVWIGTISYSLYLFHDLILGMGHVIFSSQGAHNLETGKGLLVSIGAFGISLLFSWFVYKKLETPFVSFGKKFKYSA